MERVEKALIALGYVSGLFNLTLPLWGNNLPKGWGYEPIFSIVTGLIMLGGATYASRKYISKGIKNLMRRFHYRITDSSNTTLEHPYNYQI